MKRRHSRSDVRVELLAAERWLLTLAERIGGGSGATEKAIRRRIADLEQGRPIRNVYGWEVGMSPVSGPWTLTATDELIAEESAHA